MPHFANATHEPETQRPKVGADPDELQLFEDLTKCFKRYAHERPQTVALVCLGIGFVLGWKLKPW
jgi:hypothetical protein